MILQYQRIMTEVESGTGPVIEYYEVEGTRSAGFSKTPSRSNDLRFYFPCPFQREAACDRLQNGGNPPSF